MFDCNFQAVGGHVNRAAYVSGLRILRWRAWLGRRVERRWGI